jgi:hypothetical protein
MNENYVSHQDEVASVKAAIRELVQRPGEAPVDLSAVALIDGYRDTNVFRDAVYTLEHHELAMALAFMCNGHLAAIEALGGRKWFEGYDAPDMPATLEEAMGR